jgi:16S rRNA processing protein RimM
MPLIDPGHFLLNPSSLRRDVFVRRTTTGWSNPLTLHFDMNINDCYKIGYIQKPHGLKGGVSITLDDEAPQNFDELETVFVEKNNRLVPHFIEAVSVRGDKAFVTFDDVKTPEQATAISKCAIYLPKSTRPKSGRGEFYDDEIIGFEVIDVEAGSLGNVTEIQEAGPNKLIAVDCDGKEVLIPIHSPFVKSINKAKKKISVELPEGFLDI